MDDDDKIKNNYLWKAWIKALDDRYTIHAIHTIHTIHNIYLYQLKYVYEKECCDKNLPQFFPKIDLRINDIYHFGNEYIEIENTVRDQYQNDYVNLRDEIVNRINENNNIRVLFYQKNEGYLPSCYLLSTNEKEDPKYFVKASDELSTRVDKIMYYMVRYNIDVYSYNMLAGKVEMDLKYIEHITKHGLFFPPCPKPNVLDDIRFYRHYYDLFDLREIYIMVKNGDKKKELDVSLKYSLCFSFISLLKTYPSEFGVI